MCGWVAGASGIEIVAMAIAAGTPKLADINNGKVAAITLKVTDIYNGKLQLVLKKL